MKKIFDTMDSGCPFRPEEVTPVRDGRLSLQSWIDIWQMLVYVNPRAAFRYALYAGYEGTFLSFADVIRYLSHYVHPVGRAAGTSWGTSWRTARRPSTPS